MLKIVRWLAEALPFALFTFGLYHSWVAFPDNAINLKHAFLAVFFVLSGIFALLAYCPEGDDGR